MEGNPISYSDPLGLEPSQACVAACTVGGGLLGGALGYIGGGLLGGAGGTLVAPGVGTLGGAIGGADLGGAAGAVGGSTAGNAVGQAMCPDDKDKEKNCRALYDTIVRSCWSISDPRKRQRCFEAAKSTYEACMAD